MNIFILLLLCIFSIQCAKSNNQKENIHFPYVEGEKECLENEKKFTTFCIYPDNPLHFCNSLKKAKSKEEFIKLLSGEWTFAPICAMPYRPYIDKEGNFITYSSNCEIQDMRFEDAIRISRRTYYGKLEIRGEKIFLRNVKGTSGKIFNEELYSFHCDAFSGGNYTGILIEINDKLPLYKDIKLPYITFGEYLKIP